MLIRLMGHFINNSQHIDKMICIKGLPKDWLFRKRGDSVELNPPFTADIPENIPKFIRHLCTPTEIVKYFPPIERGKEGVLDKMTILGVKLDYMTEAGRDMWTQIERYVDGILPRHTQVPTPVVISKDQKSPFETYTLRKRVTGGVSMEPSEIPVIDLEREKLEAPPAVVAPLIASIPVVVAPVSKPEEFEYKCKECDYASHKERAVKMHSLKHKKDKVAA